jgi:hypothetical protein
MAAGPRRSIARGHIGKDLGCVPARGDRWPRETAGGRVSTGSPPMVKYDAFNRFCSGAVGADGFAYGWSNA